MAVRIAPQPHQGTLAQAALAVLPAGLVVERNPSLRLDRRVVQLRCQGSAASESLQAAQHQFHAATGWTLEIVCRASSGAHGAQPSAVPSRPAQQRLEYNEALSVARALFPAATGCYKIGADQERGILLLRFHFPLRAQERYAEQLRAVAERTGWQVQVHPSGHQGALETEIRRLLPSQVTLTGAPSLHHVKAAAGTAFLEVTGWTLQLRPA